VDLLIRLPFKKYSMKIKSTIVLSVVVGVLFAPVNVLADIVLEFDVHVFSDLPAGSSWATLEIVDSAADEVTMTMTHNITSVEPQFISELWLNLTSVPGDMTASFGSPIMNVSWGDDFVNNAGNKWDVWIDLLTAPPEDRLNVGDSVIWTMNGTGLDSTDFWTLSTNTGAHSSYYGMAHVQSITGADSGKIVVVPEPATLVALSLGAVALLRRRRRKA